MTQKRDRREYYKKNRTKIKQQSNERYQKYKTKIKETSKRRYYDESNYPKYILWRAKRRAREKGIEFNIDVSDVKIPKKCPILDIELQRCVGGGHVSSDNSPSLDRIDPDKGYTKGNVQVISKLANVMKNNATVEQLLTFARYVINKYEL